MHGIGNMLKFFTLYTSRNSEQEFSNAFYSLCRLEITKWVIHVVTAKKCRSVTHFHTRSVPGLARKKRAKKSYDLRWQSASNSDALFKPKSTEEFNRVP